MPNSISGFAGSRLRESHDEGRGTWVVYMMGVLFGSVGHKVKIHKITPVTGKERGDFEKRTMWSCKNPKDRITVFEPPSSNSDYGLHNDSC